MCDYSLHGVKNVLAKEGQELFVNKFGTGSKGLASCEERETMTTIRPAPEGTSRLGRLRHWLRECRRVNAGELTRGLAAVCIPPGAKLWVEGIPQHMQEEFGVSAAEEVTFVQVTCEPFRYRDAFRFENGREVLIQKFPEGVSVDVLSLKSEEKAPAGIPFEQSLGRSMRANV